MFWHKPPSTDLFDAIKSSIVAPQKISVPDDFVNWIKDSFGILKIYIDIDI
jgi:hypothetical protein